MLMTRGKFITKINNLATIEKEKNRVKVKINERRVQLLGGQDTPPLIESGHLLSFHATSLAPFCVISWDLLHHQPDNVCSPTKSQMSRFSIKFSHF